MDSLGRTKVVDGMMGASGLVLLPSCFMVSRLECEDGAFFDIIHMMTYGAGGERRQAYHSQQFAMWNDEPIVLQS